MQQKLKNFWLTDSRQVSLPAQSVFFAIRGEHHDGHNFIGDLYSHGVRQFVVDRDVPESARFAGASFIRVADTVAFLQEQAAAHRAGFPDTPVLAITGSNGKTIVKEWLAQLLSGGLAEPVFTVARSPKSYNSQIGVPLSVRQLNQIHTLGIFEAGISRPHEMAALAAVIQPTIGLFTNIGTAHDEGFKTRKQKIAEKLRLFVGVGLLIYSLDQPELADELAMLIGAVNPTCQLVSWSARGMPGATYLAHLEHNKLRISQKDGGSWTVETPFTDPASLENLTHCLVVLLTLGVTNEANLAWRVARLRPVSMRLELKEGVTDSVLIDDSYNNDVAGLRLALDFLTQQSTRTRRLVILSDVRQSGQDEADLYAFIGRLLAEQGVEQVLGIGPVIARHAAVFSPGSLFFSTTSEFLAHCNSLVLSSFFRNSVVLIKGARSFAFEQIVARLQRKSHGTVLRVDLEAITHNLNQYRDRVGNQTKLMVMVKAFAYGSGSAEVARLLQFHRVDWLAVAYADEGVFLRQQGITTPIMVMNPTADAFLVLHEYQLEPEIYSLTLLAAWADFQADKAEKGVFHLKIDTGMHRLGFLESDLPSVITYLKANPALRVATVFSHLVGADDAGLNTFSQQQFATFSRAVAALAAGIGYTPIRHLLNSAGIVRFPEYKLDMVRLGIGLYGIESSGMEPTLLRPVGTLLTTISQLKTVRAGDTVGYSRRGVLPHDAQIATLAIGYADGYDRRLGNGVGAVWVNGTRCPTVGNICMDMTMIDVSQATAQEGDEVEIFGPNISPAFLAERMGTIPYEVLTGVSERVKRVFFAGS